MIGRLLLAVLLLLPAPAFADVTAIYATEDGKNSIKVEASDDGRARITFGENKPTVIYRDGTGYVSARFPRGTLTMRFDDFITLAREHGAFDPMLNPVQEAKFELQDGGQETVAGFVGTLWQIRPTNGSRENTDAVISDDPALAPLALFFRTVVPGLVETLGVYEPNPGMRDILFELLTKGALLRLGADATLDSAEVGPIEADRFELPAPVMSLEQVRVLHAGKPKKP